ncbi:ATP-binding protein [Kineococcus sp. SYSU DK002]|uniref:ATP-binding protein n=1 Tax=Kineococcus sp. SYSU DK002 TaxID=3383123 RepID=UPI003D7ED7B4
MTPEAGLDLPADLSAGRRAREFVRSRICPDHGGDVLERALLAVSELIVNAVEHGRPPVHAHVACRCGVLRLEVSDGSPQPPRHNVADSAAESGRGVALVAAVCSDWGVRASGRGKTVWCDLTA